MFKQGQSSFSAPRDRIAPSPNDLRFSTLF